MHIYAVLKVSRHIALTVLDTQAAGAGALGLSAFLPPEAAMAMAKFRPLLLEKVPSALAQRREVDKSIRHKFARFLSDT